MSDEEKGEDIPLIVKEAGGKRGITSLSKPANDPLLQLSSGEASFHLKQEVRPPDEIMTSEQDSDQVESDKEMSKEMEYDTQNNSDEKCTMEYDTVKKSDAYQNGTNELKEENQSCHSSSCTRDVKRHSDKEEMVSRKADSITENNDLKKHLQDGKIKVEQSQISEERSEMNKNISNCNVEMLHRNSGTDADSQSIYCDCKSEVSEISDRSDDGSKSSRSDPNTPSSGNKRTKSPSNSSICTYPQSTQTTMTDCCRICHCEGDAELGPLIAPCYCRGSLRYVHQACLQQWIKSSDTKHCELCGYHFVMDSRLKPFHKWKKLTMSTSERRKILCSVMFHIIAITCVIWSLYVLIERTANEIKEGKLQWPFWTKLVVVAIGFTGGLVFMYVQCKVYVQLWRRLKAFNRVIYVKNNSPTENPTDDDTIADARSISSDAEPNNQRTMTGETNESREVVVEICCRDNN